MTEPSETPGGRGKSPRWSALLQQSSDALFVLNARRRLIFANPAWESATGISLADVRGRACKERGTHLSAFAPPREVMSGQTAQVRRRVGSRWCDILFVPWKRGDEVYVVVGKLQFLSEPRANLAPIPERLLQLRAERNRAFGLDAWRSEVPQTQLWLDQIRLAAGSVLPVLIEGPPGAGKEWLARTIHHQSGRSEEYFAAIDAALPSALLQATLESLPGQRVGAVFLRNADQLSPDDQRQLLARWDDEEQPRLRYYFGATQIAPHWLPEFHSRIRPITIRLAGLKDRPDELDVLLSRHLSEMNRAAGTQVATLTEEARTILKLHNWPRNVTELREVLLRGCQHARGTHLDAGDLPLYLRQSPLPADKPIDLDAILEKVERRLIEVALEKAKQNKSKAAEMLGIWRARLIRRVEQWNLDTKDSHQQ